METLLWKHFIWPICRIKPSKIYSPITLPKPVCLYLKKSVCARTEHSNHNYLLQSWLLLAITILIIMRLLLNAFFSTFVYSFLTVERLIIYGYFAANLTPFFAAWWFLSLAFWFYILVIIVDLILSSALR